MTPGCRRPGALSGSDSAPGGRARATRPSARARAQAPAAGLPGSPLPALSRAAARARRLQGRALPGDPERRAEFPAARSSKVLELGRPSRSGPVVKETFFAGPLTIVKKVTSPRSLPVWTGDHAQSQWFSHVTL